MPTWSENMDSWIPSTMEPKVAVVKRTCAKPERRPVSMTSRWLCKTLWIQTGKNVWDLHWQRRCCGSARVKMAHGELNRPVVMLAPVFYDAVSEVENRAPLQISHKFHQTARKDIWNWKNLKFVKTQKWSKLKNFTSWDRKCAQPPPDF